MTLMNRSQCTVSGAVRRKCVQRLSHRHGSVCPSGALSLSVSGCVCVWSSLRGEADRAHGSNMQNLHMVRPAPVHTCTEKTVSAECHY